VHDRPTPTELAVAVRGFIEQELLPAIEDRRARFHTLVAINALGILERELTVGERLLRDEVGRLQALLGVEATVPPDPISLGARARELNAELAARIRRGDTPAGTLEHLERTAIEKLEVASPRYLERVYSASS
jgi:hypothetical protein